MFGVRRCGFVWNLGDTNGDSIAFLRGRVMVITAVNADVNANSKCQCLSMLMLDSDTFGGKERIAVETKSEGLFLRG